MAHGADFNDLHRKRAIIRRVWEIFEPNSAFSLAHSSTSREKIGFLRLRSHVFRLTVANDAEIGMAISGGPAGLSNGFEKLFDLGKADFCLGIAS
jgi:hypothetical protein